MLLLLESLAAIGSLLIEEQSDKLKFLASLLFHLTTERS